MEPPKRRQRLGRVSCSDWQPRDLVDGRPGLLEGSDVGDRRLGDVLQCLGREEALVGRDEHVGERQQPREGVVLDDVLAGVYTQVLLRFLLAYRVL